MVELKRFDVCLINLDPTKGREMKKVRPCLVISPDSMNFSRLNSLIVAPMTTMIKKKFPTRVELTFNKKHCHIALDQIRMIDHQLIIKKLGVIKPSKQNEVLQLLQTMFS